METQNKGVECYICSKRKRRSHTTLVEKRVDQYIKKIAQIIYNMAAPTLKFLI
mgnify:CR=1 FL=1